MHRRWASRCVGAVSAVPLGTALERGGAITVASGGDGNDVLSGDEGEDRLDGGAGDDAIVDFAPGEDRIRLTGFAEGAALLPVASAAGWFRIYEGEEVVARFHVIGRPSLVVGTDAVLA